MWVEIARHALPAEVTSDAELSSILAISQQVMHISMKHSHLKWDKLGAKKVSRISTMKPVASIKVVISGHCYNSGILTVVSTLHNEGKSTDRILPMQSLSGQLYKHAGQHLLQSLPDMDAHRLHQHVTVELSRCILFNCSGVIWVFAIV